MLKETAKKRRMSIGVGKTLTAWLLLAPTLVFLITFTVYPIFRSLYLSFHRLELGMSTPEFIGLQNYMKLASSPLFWKVIGNSFAFTLMTVIPSMVIGLALAMMLNKRHFAVGIWRTCFFYPVMMPMIAIACIWMFIYMSRNGLLDQFLVQLGLPPLSILSNRNTVLPSMAIMYIWKEAGYLMIFFLSGLQNIDPELYEAARIDGARPFQILSRITLPLLMPTMIFVSTIALTNSFKLVDHIVIMTEGAPNNASTLLLYYIYQQGFVYFDQGTASTLTVIMLVIMLLLAMMQFLKADEKIHYN